jgi:hypothetical protein
MITFYFDGMTKLVDYRTECIEKHNDHTED